MILLDAEMSGTMPEKHGLWQIAAIDSDNPTNYFFEESRIDDDEICDQQALQIIGKSEEELRNKAKQSSKEMLTHFFEWTNSVKTKICVSQNIWFDMQFITIKSRKNNVEIKIPYRTLDVHAIASLRYYQLNNYFPLTANKEKSDMDFSNVLKLCGMKDTRISIDMKTKKVIREGTPHNAFEDAKMTAECFSRLVYGKELLNEFKNQPIPEYLKK